ncbi:ATP-binding cassette domain-containing protein [Kitasatospora camelliae]|uniref:ATP-binding cassette domain-containing protein n=1 Tax=Kitasatospora camelliae TaxID=3156397 RepID=A0AAU8K3I4_9ACTN
MSCPDDSAPAHRPPSAPLPAARATGSAGVQGVAKRFGAVRALGGVTLDFPAGRVAAVTGERGAGKSTLLRILAGDHRPSEGKAVVYVSHRIQEVFQLAGRIAVLRDGELAGVQDAARTNDVELARLMAGRDRSPVPVRRHVPLGRPVPEGRHLTSDPGAAA